MKINWVKWSFLAAFVALLGSNGNSDYAGTSW